MKPSDDTVSTPADPASKDDTVAVCAGWRLSSHRPALAGRIYGRLMGSAAITGQEFQLRRNAARKRFLRHSTLRH